MSDIIPTVYPWWCE